MRVGADDRAVRVDQPLGVLQRRQVNSADADAVVAKRVDRCRERRPHTGGAVGDPLAGGITARTVVPAGGSASPGQQPVQHANVPHRPSNHANTVERRGQRSGNRCSRTMWLARNPHSR